MNQRAGGMRRLCVLALPPKWLRQGLRVLKLAGVFSCCAVSGWSAERAGTLAQVVESVSSRPGVCVVIGAADLSVVPKLGGEGRVLVNILEKDARRVRSVRQDLQAGGRYGPVTADLWQPGILPHADRLVNSVIVWEPDLIAEAEVSRVLAPGGVAWWRENKGWRLQAASWPKEYDEWTHWRHGADGNMVSGDLAVAVPAGLRWVAGEPQDAGGKKWYYDHVLVSARGRNFYVHENEVTARDAFNGMLLWKRPLKAYSFRETGTEVPDFLALKVRQGSRASKVRPVAVGERLYVAAEGKLMGLEATTGRTVEEFGDVGLARELLVEGDTLVVSDTNSVRAFSTLSGSLLWEAPIAAERIVAGDGSLFCLASNMVVRYELATGRERWRIADSNAVPATTCTYHGGVLVLEKSSWRDDAGGCGLLVYAGEDGHLLWHKDYRPDQTHYQEARAFFAQNLVWLQMAGNRLVGFEPLTGLQKEVRVSRGKHCATPVATERFFIAPECEFTDFESGARERARMFKSACRMPFIPANGLLYSFPVQCECFPMLRGYMALSSAQSGGSTDRRRLVKGPAFGRAVARSSGDDSEAEWPTYRHDPYRSGASGSAVKSGSLKRLWATVVAQRSQAPMASDWTGNPFAPGLITPPVAAEGAVYLAVPDEHRVVALDARSGVLRWSFTAGGRIDTPPTIHRGLCLFGAHDGWAYCLDAVDGEEVWRYRLAPQEHRMLAYGQIESPWPVPGSILVEGDVGFAVAGRHPLADGGLQVVALELRTGKLLWEKAIRDVGITNWYGQLIAPRQKIGVDYEPVDLMVKDGESVSMSRWRFDARNGDMRLLPASTNYQAGKLEVPRGLWGYGIRQTKMVQRKTPAVFSQEKLHVGGTNDVALLWAGHQLWRAKVDGTVQTEGASVALGAPAVHDGLITAYGRLYACTQDGRLVCCE